MRFLEGISSNILCASATFPVAEYMLMRDVWRKMMGSKPKFMTSACICFPSTKEDFRVQALRANMREKLSIEEGFFLNKMRKKRRTLLVLLD